MEQLACLSCKKQLDPEAFCGALVAYAPSIDVASFRCPSCGAKDEVQLENGAVCFGYVAAAGAAHFTRMIEIAVGGLSVSRDGDALVVELGGRTWRVGG